MEIKAQNVGSGWAGVMRLKVIFIYSDFKKMFPGINLKDLVNYLNVFILAFTQIQFITFTTTCIWFKKTVV